MNHTRNLYIIGAAALLLASGGAVTAITATNRLNVLPVPHASHFAWPGLSDVQEADLTSRLAALGHQDVTIWCRTANCSDLAEDLQYVAYQAGWDTHSQTPIMGDGTGISVQPDDATGTALAAALSATLGVKAVAVHGRPKDAAAGYSIVIGARE